MAVGRLLRALRDAQPFHVERAIDALERRQRLEVLGGDARGESGDAKERALGLADHKAIANVQALLTAIDGAYTEAQQTTAGSNLVTAVAAALLTQSTQGCRATKTNCCVWGAQSRKILRVLYWVITREVQCCVTRGDTQRLYLQSLILAWLIESDKTRQLTACLVLFELIQLHRRAFQVDNAVSSSLLESGYSANAIAALRRIVDTGSVTVKGGAAMKPTTLGISALEALILVCTDVGVSLMSSVSTGKDSKQLFTLIASMQHALSTLVEWNKNTPRRRFLVVAATQLFASIDGYASQLASNISPHNIKSTQSASNDSALMLLLWHWQATASLLCARSDAIISIRDTIGPAKAMESILLAVDVSRSNSSNSRVKGVDLEVARLRQICTVIDSMKPAPVVGKEKHQTDTKTVDWFGGLSKLGQIKFVTWIVQLIQRGITYGDASVIQLAGSLFRWTVIDFGGSGLLESVEDRQVLLDQLLACLSQATIEDKCLDFVRQSIEPLVVDLMIAHKMPVTTLLFQMEVPNAPPVIQTSLSLVRALLKRPGNADSVLGPWGQKLTQEVLATLSSLNFECARMAATCVPYLDPVACVFHAVSTRHLSQRTAASLVSCVVQNSSMVALDNTMSSLIDLWRFGDAALANNNNLEEYMPMKVWWERYSQLHSSLSLSSLTQTSLPTAVSDAVMKISFDSHGWVYRVVDDGLRSVIVRVVLRKVLGSPRDPTLFKIARELSAAGWFHGSVFYALVRPLVNHMMRQEQLQEDILVDTSASSNTAVEQLLFARLAPVLLLRVLPRDEFCYQSSDLQMCEEVEDLEHLSGYCKARGDALDDIDPTEVNEDCTSRNHRLIRDLFHVTALQVLNPLEFKEVKMLAVEILAKLPVRPVILFALSHLMAFAHNTAPWVIAQANKLNFGSEMSGFKTSKTPIEVEIPRQSGGVIAAKLLVYYLNRALSEGLLACESEADKHVLSMVISMLLTLLILPSDHEGPNTSPLADLQLGCIDWMAQLLALSSTKGSRAISSQDGEHLIDLLIAWLATGKATNNQTTPASSGSTVVLLAQTNLLRMVQQSNAELLPLQFRICCCNVLLSLLRKLDEKREDSRPQALGIARRALEIIASFEQSEIVAGGLELLFTYLFKFTLSAGDDDQLCAGSLSVVLPLVEVNTDEKVAIGALKVIGALVGRAPQVLGALPPAEFQRLSRCLANVRDKRLSSAVGELANSLLEVLVPTAVE